MPSLPEQRTKKLLESMGYVVDSVNRYEMHSGRRHDFLTVIDLIAFNETETIGIQATDSTSRSKHLHKIYSCDLAKQWLAASHRKLWLVTWGKRKAGERVAKWRSRIDDIKPTAFYV